MATTSWRGPIVAAKTEPKVPLPKMSFNSKSRSTRSESLAKSFRAGIAGKISSGKVRDRFAAGPIATECAPAGREGSEPVPPACMAGGGSWLEAAAPKPATAKAEFLPSSVPSRKRSLALDANTQQCPEYCLQEHPLLQAKFRTNLESRSESLSSVFLVRRKGSQVHMQRSRIGS